MKTNISPKWRKVAKFWLGNEEGVHCHWCKYILSDDGCASCNNPDCKDVFGERIRTGDACYAEECKYFELSEHYTKDENFDNYFSQTQ